MPEFKKLGLRHFQALCTLCSSKLFLLGIYLRECIFSIHYIEKEHFVTKKSFVSGIKEKRKSFSCQSKNSPQLKYHV